MKQNDEMLYDVTFLNDVIASQIKAKMAPVCNVMSVAEGAVLHVHFDMPIDGKLGNFEKTIQTKGYSLSIESFRSLFPHKTVTVWRDEDERES